MASFVSANELALEREKRKEQRRKNRKEILEEAKESFQKEKKRRELKKERGDDKWVAPGIDQRLEYSYEKKKKKKHKKHKKNQTKDEEKNETPSDNSEQEMWVEKAGAPDGSDTPISMNEPPQRQEWMMIPLGPSAASRQRLDQLSEMEESQRKAKEEEEKNLKLLLDQPGQHPLELNPYWKSGGCGLPEREKEVESRQTVGDGGRSWLLRSYKRALERSQEEGVSLEEIASERWGSLEMLHEKLSEAGINPVDPDGTEGKGKRQYLYSNYKKERGVSSDEYPPRRKLLKPNYEPFRPSREFVKPGVDESSLKYVGKSHGSSSLNWQKKTSQVTEHEDDSPRHTFLPSDSSPSPPQRVSSPPPQLVTDAELNSLSAKLTKAEIMGNSDKVQKLKRQLEELREIQRSQKEAGMSPHKEKVNRKGKKEGEEQVVLLTKTDRFGRVRPLGSSHSSPGSRDRYNPKGSSHTDKGKRKKYFPDDDRYSLKALIEQEKTMTAEETHSAIARVASKFVPSTNFDETVDDVLDSKSVLKHDPQKEEERARKRAIAENRAMSEALRSCKLCIGNEPFEKQLLVAIGLEVYLSVPPHEPLTEGHCLLVPREHTSCAMLMDENVWSEISIFRKGLTRMFADRDMDVVFMETYSSTHSKYHMQIECIPLPKEVGELAPMYFKKAIMESDVEWSDNKKLIDTSSKGVRGSLPKGLPYFFVEFGTDGGYGHIIEDQSKFPRHFGKEVCGGMLDVQPRLWLKPHRESFEKQKLRVLQLSQWWKPYDWTQKLKEQQ